MATELIKQTMNTAQLAELSTFDQALQLARETFGDAAVQLASDAMGDGFALLERDDKMKLVGETILFLTWTEVAGDDSRSIGENGYIVARVMTREGKKFVLTDGSTGINAQLREYSARTGNSGGLVAERGLRVSEYDYTDDKGKTSRAKTFYVDTSAA